MSRRNKDVRALWGGRFAQEAAADRNRREIEQYQSDLQHKVYERAAQLEQESVERLAEQKFREEDPEGYAYEKEQRELERAPKTFGNYLKNWWASHGRKMNDFQILDFQGYIDRANQWKSLAERTQEYWDIEDQIKNIDSQLSQLRTATVDSTNAQEISSSVKLLETQKEALTARLKELSPAVDAFKSYVPGSLKGFYQDITSGSESWLTSLGNAAGKLLFGDVEHPTFGRTSQARDEMGDITRHTTGIFANDRSRAEQKLMLNRALRAYDTKIKEWQQGVDENIKDRESYNKVDRWFLKREEGSSMNIFDSDTWLYGMPGLLAGSTSGMSKMLPAMITGAVAGAAAVATGGLAGAGIVAAGSLPAFGFNYGAGIGENNAEVAMAYNERLEEYLQNAEGREGGKSLYDDIVAEGRKKLHVGKKDMSDKEVFEQYRKGVYTINNAAANKKMRELAIGIENLMQDDMAATTLSAAIETVLQVMPIGSALKVPPAIKYQLLKTAGRRQLLRDASSKLASAAKGFEVGALASPIAGAIYAPIHAAVSPAFKRLGKMAKGALDDISRTAAIVDDIPGRALSKKFMREPKVRYMKDITGRWIASSIEEAIEEGKQNIAANRYKNGEYSSEKIKSIGETILDDFLAGSKSAALLLGMPFEGLLSETDRKTLQEMKGGLILGGLLTSIVNVALSIAPYRAEQKATTAIANAILLDKAVKLDNYNKAKIYAEAAKSSSGYQNILNAFDRLRKMNKDEFDSTGEYGIAPERIDEEVNRFGEVAKMANDAYTVKQAESQDIKLNTGEYNEFVGAKLMAIDEVTSAQEVVNEASKNFKEVQSELTEAILTAKLKDVTMVGEQSTTEEKPAEESSSPIAQHTSVEDYNLLQNVAKYSALLRRKQELELGIANAEHRNHSKIKTILQELLENTNDQIDNLKKVIESYVKEEKPVDVDDLESVEHGLVLNKLDHDKLTEAYRQVMVADQDLDLAMTQYERVVGKAHLNGKPIELGLKINWGEEFDNVTFVGGEAKNVIKEIKETIKDDDDLVSSIDEDFEDRTDDDGEEVISEQEAEDLEHTPPVENDPVKEFTEDNKKQKEAEEYKAPATQKPNRKRIADEEEKPQEPKPAENKPVEAILETSKPVSPVQPTTSPETPQNAPEQPKTAPETPSTPEPEEQQSEAPVVRQSHTITQDQQKVLDSIKKKAEESSKYVKEVTPNYYLIEVEGTEIKMPRVHSIMPQYWIGGNERGTGAFMPALQVGNVFDNLARIFLGDRQNLRAYEQNKETLVERLWNEPASHKDSPNDPGIKDMSKLMYKNIYSTRDEFAKTIDDLYNIGRTYEDLGWELSTDSIVWYSRLKDGYVAGETDMLAVDENGDIHIIDFKTAKQRADGNSPFGYFDVRYTYSIGDELERERLSLSEEDFKAGPRSKGLSKNARAFIKKVRMRGIDLKMPYEQRRQIAERNRHLKVVWDSKANNGEGEAVLMYMSSDYTQYGGTFRQSHEYKGVTKIAKESEYSDLLTAYKNLVSRNLANVVDLEVLGFAATYEHDDDNVHIIHRIAEPMRIKVSDSEEMQDMFNAEGEAPIIDAEPPVAPIAEENKELEQQIEKQELAKETKGLSVDNNPQVVQPTQNSEAPTAPLNVAPFGHSNLNPNAVHNLHPQLEKDIIFDPDFINEVIQHGSIEVYTQIVKDRNGEFPSMYVDITYKGKKYEHIYVYADPKLFEKLQTLEKNKLPGQKIVVTAASRTEGEIKKGSVRSIQDTDLFTTPVDRITFTAEGGFGIVKGNQLKSFVGDNPNTEDIIYTFTKGQHEDGRLYYLKKLKRNEGTRKDQIIPVEIGRKTLGKDADFIIDCLKNIDTLRTAYIATVKGKSVNTGISKKDLLSLIMPYIDSIQQSGRAYALLRDPRTPSVFYVVQDQKMILSVDMRNDKSIADFKKALSGLSIEQDNNILARKLGNKDANAAFKAAEKFFRNNTEGVTEVTVSDSIKLRADDFKNGGISGLAWYIKNDILVSDYDGLEKPLMSVNDIGYISTEKPKEKKVDTTNAEKDIPKQGGFSLDDVAIANWGGKKGEQHKRKTSADEKKSLLTPEQIKKHLRPILGDIVDDPNVVNIITNLTNDPRTKNACVVGKASSDAITLYGDAFTGVDYHEAFHRIFELFVPKATREALYSKVAKMQGIDLNNSTKENNYEGHRQVAEWLADKYMDYRKYNISTGIEWVDRIVNFIIDVVRGFLHIGNYGMYKLFLEINSGKYKNRRNASKENVDRFNEMFGELNYEIHQQEFQHIANDPMYEDCKNTAFLCMLLGQDIDVSGATVQNTQISRAALQRGAERLKDKGFDIFGTDVEPTEKTAAQLAMTEILVKFDAVADDMAAMMANIATDYRKIMQQEGRDDLDGGEASSSYDENFFKWSYEFNKFDKTTSRVKFFFATILDLQYADDERKTFKYATNGMGMPQLIPMNYVFNEVLSLLWDVDTIDEVVYRLSNLALQDPMYAQILVNLRKVIAGVTNEDGTTNADNEALLAQLMTTIRSNRHTFMLLRSVENAKGVYDLIIQRSDADYNARIFPLQWSQVLAKGGSETLKLDKYGRVVFNPNNKEAINTFKRISKLFSEIKAAVSSGTGNVSVSIPQYVYPEYEYEDSIGNRNVSSAYFQDEVIEDITDPKSCEKVKVALVDAFNRIGINMHKEEFEYMLTHKYGSSDWTALQQMMQSTDLTDSIGSFIFFLDNIVRNGKLNINESGEFTTARGKKVAFDLIFSEIAFVKELGNWKYEYRHAHDQLSVLATGGNRFYEISDNDYMSDVLRNLNKRGKWFDELKQDSYNYTVGEFDNFGDRHVYGSVTLQQLSNDPDLKLALKHFIGFKTDRRGDEGSDYFEISRREDYLSKVGILENDGMISLTLSDKKKYCYITGVKLPGIDYTQMRKANGNYIDLDLAKYLISVPDEVASAVYTIQQRLDVVDQFISYAKAEYESILRNGVRLNDGHTKVANFDTDELCVRFSSLLGVYETTFDKDGKPKGEQYISFNDKNKSWEENLSIAEAYFFDRPVEEQRALIGRLLSIRAEKELDEAEKLGLIKNTGASTKFKSYKNVGLNNTVITAIKNSYIAANIGLTVDEAESLAVVMYMNDISNKAIMSGQEMERLFSGNPAFYKWKYDEGKLIDRTVDELKRLGGLGSTGVNNFTLLTNLPLRYREGKYNCAEVDNEMVSSTQYEELKQSMYEGAIREEIIQNALTEAKKAATQRHMEALDNIRSDKELERKEKDVLIAEENRRYVEEIQEINESITQDIDSKSIEDLEKDYEDVAADARAKADEISSMYSKGIDVADGGAYISDEMCEALLRMEGAYSDDILEAFRILRGEVESDYLGKIDAYQKVMTSVIGNQKYTAFGRRLQNGNSVPYYHKMALFPIFDCIATGKMRNIFDKMKEQKIDMLLINSAVKVGSQGSKPINWSDFREDDNKFNPNNYVDGKFNKSKPTFAEAFLFDTYECEFDYLRKQLNTDPKEEDLLRMGTQMQKIVFSNLMPGREYTTQDGEKKTGKELLERIMHSSNELSNIGVDRVNKRFFVTNENGELLDIEGNVIQDEYDQRGRIIKARNSSKRVLDIEKFSNEVRKMMSDRGADKNIMKALEIVTTAGTNEKRLRVPLGAISNASWLESVLISELNKEIVDVNTPGAFFIQRSAWAMEGMKMYDGKKSVKGDKSARSLYNGKPLKMVNEEGSMDCVLSIDFFRSILPQVESDEYEIDEEQNKAIKEYRESLKKNHPELTEAQIELRIKATGLLENAYVYKKGPNGSISIDKYGNPIPKKKMRDMTFDEARAWLIKKGIIGENAKASIVAYRIPTQAQSSIHALRCVDVLPVVRDTVILPQEFTKITGSDFDIDKLGLSMLNFDKSGKSDFTEGSEKYYQNQLIKDYITLLIDPRSQHILHRPIDNDTKLLKDVLKEIELASGTQEMPYGFYSLSTQTERKDDYITGKIGIGPFALNNNNHILTMLYGVKFKDFPGSIMSSLGLTDLSGNRDQDGLSIMSWLSALINAHVDIAKDPYISRLNVGPFTYNLVNTLIRTGFGKKTFYLTTQPIMKELAIAYNRASSLYMLDSNKSTWKLQQEAVEEAAKNRFENVKIGDWTFDLLVQGMSDLKDTKYRSKINKYIKALFESDAFKNNANKEYDACEGVSIHVGKDDDFSDKSFLHLDADQVQLLVYLSYLQMDPYAQSVSNLVKFSKIDTKKHGKSYIEQQVFWRGFNDLFYNPTGTGLFEETGLRRMAEESYIRLKTDNAISMTKAILKDQFLQSSNAFDNAILVVLNMIKRPDSKSADLWTDIANILSASVKSEFMVNQYAKTLPLYNSTYIRDLISESEDDLEFTQEVNSNRLKVVGNPKYDLNTYIGGAVTMKFVQDGENRLYTFNIIGYDSDTNELIVDYKFKREHTGSMHIAGGKNTIYDRFMSLYLDLKDDPIYKDVLDIAGEPVNYLLKSLTAGKTFTYNKVNELDYITKHEAPDTYPTAKFVKLFNALDLNGPETNYIIDAWDQLLHDERHPKLKQFAEDLVVYSFITSGDKGGFTKFFKQVPLSWRIESGYADYIYDKLAEFKTQEIPTEQLEDAILNNWFDYQFVPTYQLATDGKPNFITYFNNSPSTGIARANYPTIVAALRQEPSGSVTPTIDADNAPMYIKIPRRREKEARDSQRRYTIYKLLSYGMLRSALHGTDEKGNPVTWYEWVHYPIYVKVEPKGNLLTLNYLITEYMREDSTNKEYAPNQETLRGLYKLGDFISQSTIEQYKPKYGEMLTQMIQDMNYQDVFEERFGSNEADFDKAVRRTSRSDNPKDYQMQSGGANGADTVWGEIANEFGVTEQNHWYYQEKTPNGNVEISQQDYEEGRYKVAEAARMNWGYQYKTMKDSRLIRNWALVKYADSVFAIGHLVNTGENLFPNQQDDTRTALVPAVQGGTGYAVGMAIINKVPVYVYDQERKQWFANLNGEWKRVDTPVLTERFAGIGTRQINDAGKQAIRDVFEKTFNKQELQIEEQNVLIGNINNLVGKEIYAGTKDKEGFHEDELYGEIISIKPVQDGYSMRAEIEGREYFINLTPSFEIANEKSKFHEILIIDGDKYMKLQDVVWGKDIKYDNIDDAVNGPSNGIQDLYMTDDEKKEEDPISRLKKLGSIKRVVRNYISTVIKELDKNRSDYDNVVKRSPAYITLLEMLDPFKRVADINIRVNISDYLKERLKWLKDNELEFERLNLHLLENATDAEVEFYHYYLLMLEDFVHEYIQEVYNVEPDMEDMPWSAGGEYFENPVEDNKRNKSPKLVEYERFFNNPLNSRFEKLAKVVFNLIDKFGIEIEHDQNLLVLGRFVRGYNKILIKPDHISENTLLHECIHAVTSYYCDAYEDNKESLPKEILTAIEELKYCYKLLKDDAYETGALTKGGAFETYELAESDKYGLTNLHEFIAELSNPDFIGRIKDYDKRHDSSVFDKLIDIIARILGIKKEYKDVMTTSYQALKVLLESPDKSLYDLQEQKIRTMKDNLAKINTDNTLSVRQNKKYMPIIDAIKNAEEGLELSVIMDGMDIEWMWYIPNVKNTKFKKGDVVKVISEEGTGYIALSGPVTKFTDRFTDTEKPFEMRFKMIMPSALSNISFKMVQDNDSYTLLSEETFDLLQKVYRNSKNNTEENRKKVERYVKNRTLGFYKFKNKLILAYRAVKEINDMLGTTFSVEIDKTTLNITIPSKSVYSENKLDSYSNTSNNKADSIFALIANEPSYDSAVQILEQNGYSTNDDSVRQALGQLVKNICKGGK